MIELGDNSSERPSPPVLRTEKLTTAMGQSSAFVDQPNSGRSAPKAATPVLPIGRGIKPPALLGEPVDQHVEEQPDLGA
jgi:hypothetical protein